MRWTDDLFLWIPKNRGNDIELGILDLFLLQSTELKLKNSVP